MSGLVEEVPEVETEETEGFPSPPRLTKVVVTVAGLVGVGLLVGFVGLRPPILLAAVGGLSLSLGIALVTDDQLYRLALGCVVLLPASGAVVGAASLLVMGGLPPVSAVAFFAAAFLLALGLAATWYPSIGGNRLLAAAGMLGYLLLIPGLAILPAIVSISDVVRGSVEGVDAVLDLLLTPSDPAVSLVVFPGLLAVVCVALRLALQLLPVVELVPDDAEATWGARAHTVELGLRIGIVGFGVLALAMIPLTLGEDASAAEVFPSVLYEGLVAVATASGLRQAVFLVMVAAVGIALLLRTVTGVAGVNHRAVVTRLIPISLGGLVTLGLATALPAVLALVGQVPGLAGQLEMVMAEFEVGAFHLLTAGVVGVLGAVALLLFGVTILGGLGVIPERGVSSTTVAAGLFLVGIGVGIGQPQPVVIAALVALSLVVWDAGRYGVDIATELGPNPGSTTVEVAHLGGSLVTALVAVPLVVQAMAIPQPLGVSTAVAIVAFVVLMAGLLLVAVLVRG